VSLLWLVRLLMMRWKSLRKVDRTLGGAATYFAVARAVFHAGEPGGHCRRRFQRDR